jgi:hypothetical protein
MSPFSAAGSKIVPCPSELPTENRQEIAIFGKGRGLLLCLLSHTLE